MDHQPVVAIVGQQATHGAGRRLPAGGGPDLAVQGRGQRIRAHGSAVPAQVRAPGRPRDADRHGASAPSPASSCPTTCRRWTRSKRRRASTARRSRGVGYTAPQIVPQDEDLQRAADVLNEGKKVAMLVGAGALGAHRRGDGGRRPARRGHGQGAAGQGGAAGRSAVRDRLDRPAGHQAELGHDEGLRHAADGRHELSRTPSSARRKGRRGACRSTSSARMLSLRYPMEVNLHGDSALTLRALMPLLRAQDGPVLARGDRGGRQASGGRCSRARRHERCRSDQPAARLLGALAAPAGPTASSRATPGSAANWWARDLKMRRGMMASLSGNLATMGPGVPYAIAAKFAYPDRPVIAMVGDGAMQMNGNNGLITIAKYWKEWSDPRLIVLRAEQPRPEPGDVGAAGDGGRSEVRGVAEPAAMFAYAAVRRDARARRASRSSSPEEIGAGLGRRRWPPTGRCVVEARHRSGGAAAAAAHHVRAGASISCSRRSRATRMGGT